MYKKFISHFVNSPYDFFKKENRIGGKAGGSGLENLVVNSYINFFLIEINQNKFTFSPSPSFLLLLMICTDA